MLYIAVCLCWAASVFAAPAPTDVVPLEKQQPTVIPIVSQSDELELNGTYHFSYETGNGIKRDEISYDKKVAKVQGRSAGSDEGGEDDSDEIHVQIGSYSYTAPDGTLISVKYIADENGFQPIGDHIPRVPSTSGSSSAEKSGRSLSVSDSAASSSEPAAKVSKVAPPAAPGASEEPSSTSSSEEATTKAFEKDVSTTKATNEAEGSTVEAGSTTTTMTANSSEPKGSTIGAASSEASTAVTEASSTAKLDDSESSTAKVESSTPSADTPTTETSPSTTAAA